MTQRLAKRHVVTAVDASRHPALDGEAGLESAGPSQRRALVVDGDDRQPVEAERPGDRDRLGVRALVELSVADQADDTERMP